MAVLRQVGELSKRLLKKNTPFIYAIRKYEKLVEGQATEAIIKGRFPAQLKHMPGPYPKTEEERRKAAEKYNLHIDEYKPYPNDHRHSGDYPDLPWISYDARDPYYPWDIPHLRRNYEEPIHKFYDQMLGDKYDYGVRKHIDDGKAALIFCLIFFSAIGIGLISGDTSQPFMEKQYPREGQHYTFELVK